MSDLATKLPDLAQFTGSESVYRHALLRRVVFTEGVNYVAEKAGAHWLVDVVASHQVDPKVAAEPFQVWKLVVEGSTGTVTCTDGNCQHVVTQEIGFTDFPAPGIEFWCVGGTILLPTEY